MTNEEMDLMLEEAKEIYDVRNFHYASSGRVPEQYQELYYGLQDLEQELINLMRNTSDNSILSKISNKKMQISGYLNDIREFGAYNDLNIFFGCNTNDIIPVLNKDIKKIKEKMKL